MRQHILLAAAGIAASLVFGQTAAQQPGQLFTITISPLSKEVEAGTEVMIKVRLTNVSSHDILGGSGYHAQGLDMSYQYECHDGSAKSVAKEINPAGSVHDVLTLKPGESHEETVPIMTCSPKSAQRCI
jgi:hypothetical protein